MQRRGCAHHSRARLGSRRIPHPSWLSVLLSRPNVFRQCASFPDAPRWRSMQLPRSRTRRAAAPSIPSWLSGSTPWQCGSHPKTRAVDIGRKRQVWPLPNPTIGSARAWKSRPSHRRFCSRNKELSASEAADGRLPEPCGGRAPPAAHNRGAYLCCRLQVAPLVGDVVR